MNGETRDEKDRSRRELLRLYQASQDEVRRLREDVERLAHNLSSANSRVRQLRRKLEAEQALPVPAARRRLTWAERVRGWSV